MKPLSVILTAAVVVVGFFFYFNNSPEEAIAKTPEVSAPSSAAQPPVSAQQDSSPSQVSDTEVEDLLDALIEESKTDKKIVYAGGELTSVEGLYLEENEDTGAFSIIGFTKLETVTGKTITSSDESATLIFDPESGQITIEAESVAAEGF